MLKRKTLMLAVQTLLAAPWALMPDCLPVIANQLIRAGVKASDENDDETDWKDWEAQRLARMAAVNKAVSGATTVAVINISGVITQYEDWWSDGTSLERVGMQLQTALSDPSIQGILLNIDSPGGSVYGCDEMAAQIFGARAQKPVVAISNSLAASAAYYLGCAASEFYCTPSGEVGSIGVFAMHQDMSKYLDELGIKLTFISAGKFKTEGNPYEPLGDEAKAAIQTRIDEYYSMFVKAVGKYRGTGVDAVRNGMGQARVLGPVAAKAENMIDGTMTFTESLNRVGQLVRANAKTGKKASITKAQNELSLLQ